MDEFVPSDKKTGDPIKHEEWNTIARVVNRVSQGDRGGYDANVVAGSFQGRIGKHPWMQRIVEISAGPDETTGLYKCKPRYYDPTVTLAPTADPPVTTKWKTSELVL